MDADELGVEICAFARDAEQYLAATLPLPWPDEDPATVAATMHEVISALAQLRRSLDLALTDWRQQLAARVVKLDRKVDLGVLELVAKKKYRDRYDHGRIVAAAVRAAITDEDGELIVDDPRVAAERTAALMMELYVAPASEPKKEPLQRLHFEGKRGALASHEHIGWEVEVRAK